MHTWLCASSFAHNGPRPEATPRGDDPDSAIIGLATDQVTPIIMVAEACVSLRRGAGAQCLNQCFPSQFASSVRQVCVNFNNKDIVVISSVRQSCA